MKNHFWLLTPFMWTFSFFVVSFVVSIKIIDNLRWWTSFFNTFSSSSSSSFVEIGMCSFICVCSFISCNFRINSFYTQRNDHFCVTFNALIIMTKLRKLFLKNEQQAAMMPKMSKMKRLRTDTGYTYVILPIIQIYTISIQCAFVWDCVSSEVVILVYIGVINVVFVCPTCGEDKNMRNNYR